MNFKHMLYCSRYLHGGYLSNGSETQGQCLSNTSNGFFLVAVRRRGTVFQTHAKVGILVMGVRRRGNVFQKHPMASF